MGTMRKVAIFGAGQAGFMVGKWLPADWSLQCYIDNDPSFRGGFLSGVRIVSLEEALAMGPDAIFVAVINRDSAAVIVEQVHDAGFSGELVGLDAFRTWQDVRLAALRLAAEDIDAREVPGAVAELGVYQGAFASQINRLFPNRSLYLFDTFSGFDEADLRIETLETGRGRFRDFSDTCIERVRAALPVPENAVFVAGRFPESLEGLPEERFALVSLDPDLYEPTRAGLEYFWPRLERGGRILVHDYTSMQFPGVKKAVDEFCTARGLFVIALMDLHGTAVLMKQG